MGRCHASNSFCDFMCLLHLSACYILPAQSKGANVNSKDGEGYTAFIFAALNGHRDIVEYLVVRGAENRDFSRCTQDRTRNIVFVTFFSPFRLNVCDEYYDSLLHVLPPAVFIPYM
jgi:ankyrin repeat protein